MGDVPPLTALAYLAGGLLAFMYVRTVWARRENLLYNVRAFVVCAVIGAVIYWLMQNDAQLAPAAPLTAILVAGLAFRMRPGRRRYVRAPDRRRAIAKWELKTGKKFDPRKHELDHVVPFSRGGSSTRDNLRVEDRKYNRSKGAKSTSWWDLLR